MIDNGHRSTTWRWETEIQKHPGKKGRPNSKLGSGNLAGSKANGNRVETGGVIGKFQARAGRLPDLCQMRETGENAGTAQLGIMPGQEVFRRAVGVVLTAICCVFVSPKRWIVKKSISGQKSQPFYGRHQFA